MGGGKIEIQEINGMEVFPPGQAGSDQLRNQRLSRAMRHPKERAGK